MARKVNPADVVAQLERKGWGHRAVPYLISLGGYAPAGVVVLNKVAKQKVEAALAPLRDADGYLRPILPKHWRFKAGRTERGLGDVRGNSPGSG